MEMEMDIHKFDNISVEILSRLPANSLLRFRWACKYWFDLIRDPNFVNKHLSIHHPTEITSTTHDPVSVLISSSPLDKVDSHKLSASFTQCSKCYIDYTSTRISSRPIKIALPSEFIVDFRILGSCHGLLFFSSLIGIRSNITTLYIWNPCTKEYKEIPPLTPPLPPNYNDIYALHVVQNYGFGYDCTIDDYKVIQNTYYYASGNNCVGTHVQVYTLGTNSWISIGHMIPCTLLPYSSVNGLSEKGVFVNGALYWIGYSKSKIISFDIGKETYQEISNLPEYFHDDLKLEMFEGSLCLLSNIKHPITQENFTEMWVMENNINNNVESSCTKLFRMPRSLGSSMILKPLMRLTTNGEILFLKEHGGRLFSFDPESNSSRILNRVLRKGKDICVEAVYTDSLVSLNSRTYT